MVKLRIIYFHYSDEKTLISINTVTSIKYSHSSVQMHFFQLCQFLFFLISISKAKSLYADSVSDSKPFDQEYKSKFLKNVNVLNKLQAKIMNLTYTPEEVTLEILEDNIEYKPMENPYLFQGDIILTDKQWDILFENGREACANSGNEAPSEPRRKRAIASNMAERWTFPIPFYIKPELNASLIMSVMNKYEAETCVRFKRHNEPIDDSMSSLLFIHSSG